MNFIEVILALQSPLGTPMKGDTLFGRFCWEIVHSPALLDQDFDLAIQDYPQKPFAVFSSAIPCLAPQGHLQTLFFPAPAAPPHVLMPQNNNQPRLERMIQARALKRKKWLTAGPDLTLDPTQALITTETLASKYLGPDTVPVLTAPRWGNTINRLTGATGKGEFAPFTESATHYAPQIKLALYILHDEQRLSRENLLIGLNDIGAVGFGKNASTGMGRFTWLSHRDLPTPRQDAHAVYTLAPHVPGPTRHHDKEYAAPFVRFGKHGDRFGLTGNPFKKPVPMADQGAVLTGIRTPLTTPYVGRAVTHVSQSARPSPLAGKDNTVHQGFSPYLPINLPRLTP